jgi:hypothetical protein
MIVGVGEAPQMKFVNMNASMPRPQRFVCAGFAIALVLAATAPAFAGRQVRGDDVARMLNGKQFQIECIDGTVGRGQVNQFGMATVAYRRPTMSSRKPDEFDNAVVRVRGAEICLAWRRFGGGGDGCYPVSEESAGVYRLSTGPLWCDISPK